MKNLWNQLLWMENAESLSTKVPMDHIFSTPWGGNYKFILIVSMSVSIVLFLFYAKDWELI